MAAGVLASLSLNRIVIKGASTKPAERWNLSFRVRDVEQAPDGALCLLEDAAPGGLYRLTPK
ncbi:PQQ-dependent sugar dehydrogenase [Paucibacter sp. R3-3]|uniref:PQQ-dependent sugar dehydrogenase n=1 Tax=Roseateles agri TaxID=3098619 RepID=A0ABU5DRL2_9BURK|nr:PQQ-dependent sugar dehydrogenase [Paucibacter sp. R3-3]MDY0748961.1 PQQ-dependent sugar dehydrogenase [Paucibacter sp. R3-3]